MLQFHSKTFSRIAQMLISKTLLYLTLLTVGFQSKSLFFYSDAVFADNHGIAMQYNTHLRFAFKT